MIAAGVMTSVGAVTVTLALGASAVAGSLHGHAAGAQTPVAGVFAKLGELKAEIDKVRPR